MGLAHSPRIVTDGLVFAMDGGNPDKSWKGKPTTNLTPDMQLTGMGQGLTFTYVGLENGWKKYSINGTWTGGTYPYSFNITSVAFTGGVTYSSGVFVKTNVPNKFATLFTGMNYVNEPKNIAGTSFSIAQPDGSFYVGRSGFQYTNTTTQPGYILSQPVIGQTFSSASDFVYIKDGQVETGSFSTPFTSGTRSNTQAIKDLTGQNTITATSLTYASNNTFSFNGSSDYITTPLSLGSTDPLVSINMWIKRTASFSNAGYWGLGGGSSGNGINGYTSAANKIGWDLWGLTTFHTGQDYPLNQWVNVCWIKTAASFTTSTLKVYINGIDFPLTTTVRNNSSSVNLATGFNVGRLAAGVSLYYAPGDVDVTGVYNRALSAEEVKQNFNALRGRYGI